MIKSVSADGYNDTDRPPELENKAIITPRSSVSLSKTKHLQWNKDKNEVHLHDGGSADAASELQLLTTKLDRDT